MLWHRTIYPSKQQILSLRCFSVFSIMQIQTCNCITLFGRTSLLFVRTSVLLSHHKGVCFGNWQLKFSGHIIAQWWLAGSVILMLCHTCLVFLCNRHISQGTCRSINRSRRLFRRSCSNSRFIIFLLTILVQINARLKLRLRRHAVHTKCSMQHCITLLARSIVTEYHNKLWLQFAHVKLHCITLLLLTCWNNVCNLSYVKSSTYLSVCVVYVVVVWPYGHDCIFHQCPV